MWGLGSEYPFFYFLGEHSPLPPLMTHDPRSTPIEGGGAAGVVCPRLMAVMDIFGESPPISTTLSLLTLYPARRKVTPALLFLPEPPDAVLCVACPCSAFATTFFWGSTIFSKTLLS